MKKILQILMLLRHLALYISKWKFLCWPKFCYIFKNENIEHSNFNLIQKLFIKHKFVDKDE